MNMIKVFRWSLFGLGFVLLIVGLFKVYFLFLAVACALGIGLMPTITERKMAAPEQINEVQRQELLRRKEELLKRKQELSFEERHSFEPIQEEKKFKVLGR